MGTVQRRSAPAQRSRPVLSDEDVDALTADTVQPFHDRALWSLPYESVARSEEVLFLDIRAHRAKVRRNPLSSMKAGRRPCSGVVTGLQGQWRLGDSNP
ncbi:hypothetical protein AB0I28_21880 [Phytomonospora sp. NPDC050363]|uniref:hypothetical protein n=1 Tax=Phytomonospora sp. NPDC050363 TaxID=3155642 RepID=UPI0033D55173